MDEFVPTQAPIETRLVIQPREAARTANFWNDDLDRRLRTATVTAALATGDKPVAVDAARKARSTPRRASIVSTTIYTTVDRAKLRAAVGELV